MAEFQNRTLICSVLFIDIVDYSRKAVVEQIELKDRFNALISDALRGVAVNDRIILDTGDGAAISFIGDPEDALFVATGLREVIAAEAGTRELELATRMGINLGPVRLVKDINGQPNIIGDGINVAQRVMSFARPGQVLVSRSYYEVVSRLTDESSRLFTYEGSRTDKHVREHEVYAIGAIPAPQRRVDDIPAAGLHRAGMVTGSAARAHVTRVARATAGHVAANPRAATLLAVCSLVLIGLGTYSWHGPADAVPASATPVTRSLGEDPRTEATVRPGVDGGQKLAPTTVLTQPAAPSPPRVNKPQSKTSKAESTSREAPNSMQMAEVKPAPKAPAKSTQAAVEAPAVLTLAIAPWGEVYIDGNSKGVTPPLQELELEPGRHRIEIRNAESASHVVAVHVKAGERVRIKHKFQ
jgi:class 3 adenylate cyclase